MSTTTIIDDLEHLSTTTSRSETPTPERQDDSAGAASKVLQVPTGPALQGTRLWRTLKLIIGSCPLDVPLEHDATLSILDRRTVASLSIRYRCVKDKGYLLPDEFKQELLPSVVFEVQQDADGRYFPCIDIALPNAHAFRVVRSKLDKIEVQGDGREAFTFAQHNWQNTLAPDVLPLDILRLPLAEAGLDVFFASVKHMASAVGTAMGAGLVCVTEGTTAEACSANIVRVYIKLSPEGMRLKMTELVDRLPSKFEWKGVAYTCHFAGQKLRHWPQLSASYPLQQVGTAPAPAPAAAAAKKNPVPVGSASVTPTLGTRVATGISSTSQAAPAIKTSARVSATGGTTAGTGAAVGMSSSSQAVSAAEKSTSAGMGGTTGVRSSTAAATSSGASRTASSRTQEQEEGACTPA